MDAIVQPLSRDDMLALGEYFSKQKQASSTFKTDPAKVALPVLTIAMDLGYGSLAPFNRAFRDTTGQTPTDWRRAALGGFENS